MKKVINSICALIMIFVFSPAFADETIIVQDAWVRAAPPSTKALAGYMRIKNNSTKPVVLTTVSSPQFKKVEMHKTEMHEGMMKMIPQKQLRIPPKETLTLEPGSYHLMLINPRSVPQEGEQVDIELHFDNGQTLHISVPVRTTGDNSSMNEMHRH